VQTVADANGSFSEDVQLNRVGRYIITATDLTTGRSGSVMVRVLPKDELPVTGNDSSNLGICWSARPWPRRASLSSFSFGRAGARRSSTPDPLAIPRVARTSVRATRRVSPAVSGPRGAVEGDSSDFGVKLTVSSINICSRGWL
jgi:hypothetical protein